MAATVLAEMQHIIAQWPKYINGCTNTNEVKLSDNSVEAFVNRGMEQAVVIMVRPHQKILKGMTIGVIWVEYWIGQYQLKNSIDHDTR